MATTVTVLGRPTDGTMFEFGQPVLLQVSMPNQSSQTFPTSKRMLDPKGNFLGVAVRRVNSAVADLAEAAHFHPQTLQEEREALTVLMREDVGTFFALGGSSHLGAAHRDLDAICKRRMHRRKTASDPIAANILRCLGIDAGRWSLSSDADGLAQLDSDPQRAVDLLSQLEKGGGIGLRTFDAEIARRTKASLAKHKRRIRSP